MSGNHFGIAHWPTRFAAISSTIALAAFCTGTPASAAPLKKQTTVVQSSWDGLYVGLGVGSRSTQTEARVTDRRIDGVSNFAANCAALAQLANFGGCLGDTPLNNTDFRFSPYIGFNWQFARQWVAGIEGDWGSGNKTTTLSGMVFPINGQVTTEANETFSVKTTWDASARARIGFLPNPSVMLYATGGAAWLHVSSTSTCNTKQNGTCSPILGSGPIVITNATTKAGWTVGGGVEAMLGYNWIVRGEYRYADFGTIAQTTNRLVVGGLAVDSDDYQLRIRTHTATLGLAYKFGGERRVAEANDAQASVPESWGGPYLGLGLGARATRSNASVTSFTRGATNVFAEACMVDPSTAGCIDGQPFNDIGFRISPYAGYNWHVARQWVLGIEGDFGFADKTTTLEGMNYPFNALSVQSARPVDSFSVRTTWDASLRGRAGFVASPAVMVYGTAGPAWMHIESTSTCSVGINALCEPPGVAGPLSITHATTKLGWTAGAGVEGKLWSNWIARAEYRYADFGKIYNSDVRTGTSGMTATYDVSMKSHTATLGLAYKLDWDRPTATR